MWCRKIATRIFRPTSISSMDIILFSISISCVNWRMYRPIKTSPFIFASRKSECFNFKYLKVASFLPFLFSLPAREEGKMHYAYPVIRVTGLCGTRLIAVPYPLKTLPLPSLRRAEGLACIAKISITSARSQSTHEFLLWHIAMLPQSHQWLLLATIFLILSSLDRVTPCSFIQN